jgi:hypothetical protein
VILLAFAALAVSMRSPVPDVPTERLLIDAPPELPGVRNVIWTSVLESVDREGVGVVSEWSAATLGALVTHEVGHFSNWLAAEWQLRMHSPAGRYARLFGSDLVREVKPPQLSADSYRVFCGNIGKSLTDELEDCQIWVMRARYGRYVMNFELYNFRMTRDDFYEIVDYLDRRAIDELAG